MTAYEINIFLLCASFALNFNEEFLAHASILPYENITLVADEYVLPQLPYNYEDLEPHMDAGTVRLHHTGHHAAYTRLQDERRAQQLAGAAGDGHTTSPGCTTVVDAL